MARPVHVSPAHACIRNYYQELEQYHQQGVAHEGALRTAFQNLLSDTLPQGWSLSPEYGMKGSGGRLVRPDGAILDRNYFPRGYWEAKDPTDRLDAEIARKKEKGYPLKNTIFENTREAILFQNREPLPKIQLGDPAELAQLLNWFYSYTEPEVLGFEEAVANFQEEVPHPLRPQPLVRRRALHRPPHRSGDPGECRNRRDRPLTAELAIAITGSPCESPSCRLESRLACALKPRADSPERPLPPAQAPTRFPVPQ